MSDFEDSPCEGSGDEKPTEKLDRSWLVKSHNKLWVPGDDEFLHIPDDFSALEVENGTAMGELVARTTTAGWKKAGFHRDKAVILRSVTNDQVRMGMYTCIVAKDNVDCNDFHTLINIKGKLAEEFVKEWKEEINALTSEEQKKECETYLKLLDYEKPAEPPEPKNSKNWKESTTWTVKNWTTALVKKEVKPRSQKKEGKLPENDEPELTGAARTVKPGTKPGTIPGWARAGPKDEKPKANGKAVSFAATSKQASSSDDDEFDVDEITRGVRKRRRMGVDDYKGKLVTVPAWLFDEAMTTWMKHKKNKEQ